MPILLKSPFPPHIHNLIREMSGVGFFERSLLIGSWVMPIYQELYQAHYALKTLDVDFAVHIAHLRRQMRADLEKIITDLGFTDYIAAEGIQNSPLAVMRSSLSPNVLALVKPERLRLRNGTLMSFLCHSSAL